MIPTIDVETYKKILPSSGETISIRPILIKEEKIYLMGKDSNSSIDFFDSLIHVLQNCTVEPKIFKIDDMSYNDFVWLWIQLRRISKGEILNLDLVCKNPKCLDEVINEAGIDDAFNIVKKIPHIDRNVQFNLGEVVKIENPIKSKRSNMVKLTDNLAVQLVPAKVSYLRKLESDNPDTKKEIELLLKNDKLSEIDLVQNHIVAVIKNDERTELKTAEDKKEFIDSLREINFKEIKKWFAEEPRPVIELEWTCSKCKQKNTGRDNNLLRFLD